MRIACIVIGAVCVALNMFGMAAAYQEHTYPLLVVHAGLFLFNAFFLKMNLERE